MDIKLLNSIKSVVEDYSPFVDDIIVDGKTFHVGYAVEVVNARYISEETHAMYYINVNINELLLNKKPINYVLRKELLKLFKETLTTHIKKKLKQITDDEGLWFHPSYNPNQSNSVRAQIRFLRIDKKIIRLQKKGSNTNSNLNYEKLFKGKELQIQEPWGKKRSHRLTITSISVKKDKLYFTLEPAEEILIDSSFAAVVKKTMELSRSKISDLLKYANQGGVDFIVNIPFKIDG